jgi:hypothetical protein
VGGRVETSRTVFLTVARCKSEFWQIVGDLFQTSAEVLILLLFTVTNISGLQA